ncbi:hypothetical protein GCM10023149_50720 [Mucilaginibacter gynuensis]|uniref:DUF3575 domain-containing protein n=1 Tax=Mucilaginibacter gynuensis TaxID=1302236 RepID=A0ABP8HJH2_9SPHI
MRTKTISLVMLIALCTTTSTLLAQYQRKINTFADTNFTNTKNLVKLNVTALLLKNISVQYERAVGKKISVALGVRYMPKSGLPFKSSFDKLIDDDETSRQLDGFKTGNISFTPEVRFYTGSKGVFRGFYIAPFAKISNYTAELPYYYTVYDAVTNVGTEKSIFMSGNLKTFTGGVMIGAQWKLPKQFYLDWWIFGPSYGTSSGKLTGTAALSQQEQDELRSSLESLDIPLTKSTATVNNEGARLDIKGPWAGIRAGLAIGYRF